MQDARAHFLYDSKRETKEASKKLSSNRNKTYQRYKYQQDDDV
jgi:hypothetical protein